MILAKGITIILKTDEKKYYLNVTQMYTVGNFLTITGDLDNDSPKDIKSVTERFVIADLLRMFVEF